MQKPASAQTMSTNSLEKEQVNTETGTQHVPLATLFKQLDSSEQGLTSEEAAKRLSRYGPNEPTGVQRSAAIRQLLTFLLNPLVIILLIASITSAVLGEPINASIIIAMVFLSAILNFFQTYRSQRAVERLREGVALSSLVLRDGIWSERPRRILVPGDIIRLVAGDMVPADARLIQTVGLHVQQAALTGKSMPVEKEAKEIIPTTSKNLAEARNMVYLGTSVVSGTATALIILTGQATAFGDIAARLATRPPETEFERGIRSFGLLIMRTVFFLVLFVFLVSIALHRPTFKSLLFAVSLAVGLTPEFLPMITTVTLAQGASHMAKQKVVVKNLASMQNFGSTDILCSDKTGTLTSGNMSLQQYL